MDIPILHDISPDITFKDVIAHKPCLANVEFIMPPNFSFTDKMVTIMLHNQNYVAFARSHQDKFLLDFLNFNQLTWNKKLRIMINKLSRKFVAYSGIPNLTYFLSLEPTTFLIRFDEDSWSYQILNIFDRPSKGSFINGDFLYIIQEKYIYSIELQPIFESNTDDQKSSKQISIQKSKFSINFDQIQIFATQQFYCYNLIYTDSTRSPLLIFNTLNNDFCFEEELSKISHLFKRKPSSIFPLNEAKFMPVPKKNNCFLLFHDFDSFQNTIIPFNEPYVIKECLNGDNEPLTIINVSIKRISPIIAMFNLPEEGFNFITVSTQHYYQFYTSCGLLNFISHSRDIINSNSKLKSTDEAKEQPLLKKAKDTKEPFSHKEAEELKDLFLPKKIEETKEQFSPKEVEKPNKSFLIKENKEEENGKNPTHCLEINEKNINDSSTFLTPKRNSMYTNEPKLVSSLNISQTETNKELYLNFKEKPNLKKIQEKVYFENNSKISVSLHFLSLGPLQNIQSPEVEIGTEPEYHLTITTPIIPHFFLMKSIEILVSCDEDNDVLSFFVKPSICNEPQKVEIRCNPDSKYRVKLKVSNGCQSTFSDPIEFTTPSPGIPPKVKDFNVTIVSEDTFIFKWTVIPDAYCVKSYILEGLPTDPEQNQDEFNQNENELDKFIQIEANDNHEINFDFDMIDNQKSEISDNDFEFVVELNNDPNENNICGAKLKLSQRYKSFRIRALNEMGMGPPSDQYTISSSKLSHKFSPRISKDQVRYLSEFYQENPNPDQKQRTGIADLLFLPYKTVNSWFARKRHLDKVRCMKSKQQENK